MIKRLRSSVSSHMRTAFIAAVFVSGCSTVPGIGRERINFMPAAQMSRLGGESFASILKQREVVETGVDVDRVQRIGRSVVRSARALYPEGDLPKNWEIVLIQDDTPNAFALPGGRIGVHTGMVELAGDDDGLGIVIGHEVGHVLAQHSAERMSQSLVLAGGLAVGSVALKDEDAKTQRLVLGAMGVGASLGVALPFSRLHESEADELGLLIAANAGFDPRKAIGLWERMAAENSGRLEFLSTHPLPTTRIADFERLMPAAMVVYRRAVGWFGGMPGPSPKRQHPRPSGRGC